MRFRNPAVPLTEEQLLNRKRVLYQVTTEPQTFSMSTWDVRIEPPEELQRLGFTCSTVRCIAGWALYFGGADIIAIDAAACDDGGTDIEAAGIALLGLTSDEYYGAPGGRKPLFYDTEEDAVDRLRALCAGGEGEGEGEGMHGFSADYVIYDEAFAG